MLSDQECAEKCAAIMWQNDDASQATGMILKNISPGQSKFSLKVETRHTNGHDMCHGGIIFTLADTAFAFACNSYNQSTVAQHNIITYNNPAMVGDLLTATAIEVERSGRSGVYDVHVKNQNNLTIALFRGACRTIKGQLFDEET